MGAADPFLMGPTYAPAPGIRRFLSGTPPIVGMLPVQDMVALIERGRAWSAVREKSVALTTYAVELADELPRAARRRPSPRRATRRGAAATSRSSTRGCARSPRRCGSAT